jgi:eukaryotic-like serine/threonine-protein kinase
LLGNLAAMAERPSWEFAEGDEIASERSVLRSLGGGSRYEVYLVWDERMFAICVAKLLRPDQVTDERALRDLGREAEVLERLAHPVIVRGFDAVLDGPHPHVLIEHLEGPSLRRLIRRGGPLPLQQLLPLALHVAGALQYLNREEVVHLDVKPDNIVMGVPPRLIDLSVARSFARAAKLTTPIGTDAYMAPEQCDPERFRGAVGHAADVWGLGATLQHAVSGTRPFPRPKEARESDLLGERFPQLVRGPEALPGETPDALCELIATMLEPDTGARPTAGEVAARLEPLVAELPRRISFSRRGAGIR